MEKLVRGCHIQDKEQRDWIMDKIENINKRNLHTKVKKQFWKDLQQQIFETFLDKKYTGTKIWIRRRVTYSSSRTNS